MNLLPINSLADDIYYKPEYTELYIVSDDSEPFEYTYSEDIFYVTFRSIKRRINVVAGKVLQKELYDLETSYGYGGPLTNSSDIVFLNRAFKNYKAYCATQSIVCEFIRFHPFNALSKYPALFDMHCQEREVVLVDLTLSTEERRALYSKTTRNIVKKAALNLDVIIDKLELPSFMELYYQTMRKNEAADFYFFKEEYFKSLLKLEQVNLIGVLKGKQVLSAGFFMCCSELAHYHLSANSQELVKENGNYLLLDAAFEHAKSLGCRYMMLGGGRTSSADDSLFKFKAKFSPIHVPFYIAGLDFLPDTRQKLNKMWLEQHGQSVPKLFQLYRA
ncbi:GNAT family N-acetyltransferase [Alkalimonas sp. NCh-2]|uniref:GNAT family N-acetyltransferase n=1 Tax=Alkalimonas sp. NCh-2 TaxID=3144846 RepID=UPI0031F6E3B7